MNVKIIFLGAGVCLTSMTIHQGIVLSQSHDRHGDHVSHQKHHGHGKALVIKGGPNAPTLKIRLTKDADSGWNLNVLTSNFRFSPEHAGGIHIPGAGHGHIYVNGKKIARLYGPWFHITELPKDGVRVRVTLNANDPTGIL